ncbi:anti-sigma factor [Dactylosporangium sp. CS-047395]|uniref:anti-sigma factor n=1 Tax=Dactylosporangium sp. CS-047395 TaxID=3239936 RepID=UPI003D8D0D61
MHDDIHSLVGAYVLDAVDDQERVAFERHLAGCAACAADVAEFRATAAHLADGAWSAPPRGLRTAVLEQVARTRQDGPPVRAQAARATPRWRTVAAAAAAAVVLAAGASVVTYQMSASPSSVELVLSAPDATVRQAALPGGGTVTLVSSAGRDEGVVYVTAAPAIDATRAYELWLTDGATARPAGTLAAGANAGQTVVRGVRGQAALALTEERAGGVATPQGTMLAQIPLT